MSSGSPFHREIGLLLRGPAVWLSLRQREKMFRIFERSFPDPKNVLDLGATSESISKEANFFEKLFPHKNRITAAGVEDASHLENEFSGMKFVKIKPDSMLPFENQKFEAGFSNAVIEHIVEFEEKIKFLEEFQRVCRGFVVTTPNRFFPVEPHTGVPLLHMISDKLFFWFLKKFRPNSFYHSGNLKLLTQKDLSTLFSRFPDHKLYKIRFLGFVTNFVVVVNGQRKNDSFVKETVV